MVRSIAALMLCLAAVTTQAALLGRAALTPGGTDYQAYYDDVLDITWVADPALAVTNDFGLGTGPLYFASWDTAHAWLGAMNAASYLGVNGWRLPRVRPIDGGSFDLGGALDGSADYGYNITAPGSAYPGSTASEMAHLFYNTLGNTGYFTPGGVSSGTCADPGLPATCLLSKGPFTHLESSPYWAESLPADGGDPYWLFMFAFGNQEDTYPGAQWDIWAVHDGDIALQAAVPLPAAAWLFGSALGLAGLVRRQAR